MKSINMKMKTVIQLGEWKYFTEYGRFLKKDKEELFLDTRLKKLLNYLFENEGEIIRREEIIEFVWGEVIVNEENLTKAVFDLRKLLKSKGISGFQISTIRNIGYRLTMLDKPGNEKRKLVGRLIFKAAIYLFLIASFLIMFIRAIRYEN